MAYYDVISALSPDYWWRLDGDETDSADSANSDGGDDPSWVSSIIPSITSTNDCGDYNGSSDVTYIPNQSDINSSTTTQKTISVWFYADTIDTSGNGRVIWGEGGSQNGLSIHVVDVSGTPTLVFDVYEGSTHDTLTYEITTSTLYHCMFVMDATNGDMFIYLNGSQVASKTGGLNISTSFSAHSAGIAIGGVDSVLDDRNGSTLNGYFDGRIADVVYWAEQTPLDGTDASNIYAAGIGSVATLEQIGFRIHNDDGSETGATWAAALNTDLVITLDTSYRPRFGVEETSDESVDNVNLNLYCSVNGGAWVAVNGSSSYVRSTASSYFSDGDDTTQQISSGTYISNNDCMDESDGSAGGVNLDFNGNDKVEVEYCVQFRSADLSAGDAVQLRVYNGSTPLSAYDYTPTFTVPLGTWATLVQRTGEVNLESEGMSIQVDFDQATAGNLLILVVNGDKTLGDYDAITGWTQATERIEDECSTAIFYKISNGTETTVTSTWTTSHYASAVVEEYGGWFGTPTLDATADAYSGSSGVSSQTSGTTSMTTVAKALGVCSWSVDTGSNVDPISGVTNSFILTGWDIGHPDSGPGIATAVKELSSLQTVESTASWTGGTDQMVGSVAVFSDVFGWQNISDFSGVNEENIDDINSILKADIDDISGQGV